MKALASLFLVFGFCGAALADSPSISDIVRGSRAATHATDFNCVNDCTKRGYMYNYCVSRCSDAPVQSGPSGTDYTCLNDCTRQGYLYSVCQSRCSY